jgi:hypothetical protein
MLLQISVKTWAGSYTVTEPPPHWSAAVTLLVAVFFVKILADLALCWQNSRYQLIYFLLAYLHRCVHSQRLPVRFESIHMLLFCLLRRYETAHERNHAPVNFRGKCLREQKKKNHLITLATTTLQSWGIIWNSISALESSRFAKFTLARINFWVNNRE